MLHFQSMTLVTIQPVGNRAATGENKQDAIVLILISFKFSLSVSILSQKIVEFFFFPFFGFNRLESRIKFAHRIDMFKGMDTVYTGGTMDKWLQPIFQMAYF